MCPMVSGLVGEQVSASECYMFGFVFVRVLDWRWTGNYNPVALFYPVLVHNPILLFDAVKFSLFSVVPACVCGYIRPCVCTCVRTCARTCVCVCVCAINSESVKWLIEQTNNPVKLAGKVCWTNGNKQFMRIYWLRCRFHINSVPSTRLCLAHVHQLGGDCSQMHWTHNTSSPKE